MEKEIRQHKIKTPNNLIQPTGNQAGQFSFQPSARRLITALARTLRAEPTALRIAIRLLSRRFAPGHQAAAADSRPREQARVHASR